jgi:glycosyltransferase involved in cell wall biosynthesis
MKSGFLPSAVTAGSTLRLTRSVTRSRTACTPANRPHILGMAMVVPPQGLTYHQLSNSSKPALFISWVKFHGRSHDLALALGIEGRFIAVGRPRLFSAALRHPIQAVLTAFLLVRCRPRVLFIMAPPISLVAVALAYTTLTGARLVIDAHSAAVVDRNTGQHLKSWFLPVARRCLLTIVTSKQLAEMLTSQGVAAIDLHDPPTIPLQGTSTSTNGERPRVVVPSSWDSDESIDVISEMAGRLPSIDVMVTGHPRRLKAAGADIPANLRLTGHLSAEAYANLLHSSAVVIALTTAQNTMQRAAYEALAYEKPLVTSDTTVLRDFYDSGALFANPRDPDSLTAAVVRALEDGPELSRQMTILRRRRAAEWEVSLATVVAKLETGLPEDQGQ